MVLYRAEEHKLLELKRSIKVQKIEIVDNLSLLLRTDITNMSHVEKEQYFVDLARYFPYLNINEQAAIVSARIPDPLFSLVVL